MAHMSGKDIYQRLGKKIDGLTMRAPWSDALYAILRALYTHEEADLVVRMPFTLSPFKRLEQTTKYERKKLQRLLERLCSKGLVIDLWINDEYYYAPSPMVIGIFEFTMMRTGNNLDSEKWAGLFYEYQKRDDSVIPANAGSGEKISILRALPHEGTAEPSGFVEILDYEKASAIIQDAEKFAIGICSCRHEKFHVGEKECDVPLETCSSFDWAADYLIRRNLAKEVSRTEMQENFARSRELGLVLSADNVKRNITFVCHCCACCCNPLLGIKKYGYPNIVISSSFIACINEETCLGCGKCASACKIDAIEMVSLNDPQSKKKKRPVINTSICLGCGVCALKCDSGSMSLIKRGQRVIHPETTFERVILQCLERGTLQNQLFYDPQSISHKFMRAFVGATLKLPPVKKALMSDVFRSLFLKAMTEGARKQGSGWIVEM